MAHNNSPSGSLLLDRPPGRHPGSIDRDRLVMANHAAAQFFAAQLASPAGTSPREYLSGRGFGPMLDSHQWSLGYAPPTWTTLTDHLRASGCDVEELLAAGLVIRTRHGNIIDRFRDRVTLPVHNLDGETVGFVGRAAPNVGDDVPKYLNSPRTQLYDKSTLLFGLAEQQPLLASGAVPVIVEGPLDVLAVHIANAQSDTPLAAVAPCGTALTSTQVDSLAKLSGNRVLVAFDADAAGARATAAAYGLLATRFTQLHAADLAAGGDPAELLQAGGCAALREALSSNEPLADRVLDNGLSPWTDKLDNAEACVSALRELAPSISSLRPDDVTREAARLVQRLRLEPSTVTRELTAAVTARQVTTRRVTARRSTNRAASSLSTDPYHRTRAHHAMSLE